MKIRALKSTYDDNYGNLSRGAVAEIDDHIARELIAQGYAIEERPLAEQEAANDNDPLAGQTGSPTGVDALQSLLREGRAPVELTSPRQEAEQNSSPSTTDTGSADADPNIGQTHSTPAIETGGKRKRGRPRSRR